MRTCVRWHDDVGVRPANAVLGRPDVMSLTYARRGGKSPRITRTCRPDRCFPGRAAARNGGPDRTVPPP